MTFWHYITVYLYNIIACCFCYCLIKNNRAAETIIFMPYMNKWHRKMFAHFVNIFFSIQT